jgi:tRNA dimethylallyltransferase
MAPYAPVFVAPALKLQPVALRLGYRHLINLLTGRWIWEETLTLLARDTRRYAKGQLTWFSSDPEVRRFQPDLVEEMAGALGEFFG